MSLVYHEAMLTSFLCYCRYQQLDNRLDGMEHSLLELIRGLKDKYQLQPTSPVQQGSKTYGMLHAWCSCCAVRGQLLVG